VFPVHPEPEGHGPHIVQISAVFELDPHGEAPSADSLDIVKTAARNAMVTHLLSHSRVAQGEEHWDLRYYRLPVPGGLPANAVLRDGRPVISCRTPEEGAELIQVTLLRDSAELGTPG